MRWWSNRGARSSTSVFTTRGAKSQT